MVADVLNATWNKATEKEAILGLKVAASLTSAPRWPCRSTPTRSTCRPSKRRVNIPPNASTTDVMSMYDTKYLELVDLRQSTRTSSPATERDGYGEAAGNSTSLDALQNPDAGDPLAVQDKIFEADRRCILNDASRPVTHCSPPSPAPLPCRRPVLQWPLSSTSSRRRTAVAESSQKLILSVEMAFNIEKLLALRQSAISAAVEHVKALPGSDMASRVISTGYDAQSKLISSAADFYRAEIQAEELSSKVRQFNSSSKLDADSKNQAAKMAPTDAKAKALLTEVQTLGQDYDQLVQQPARLGRHQRFPQRLCGLQLPDHRRRGLSSLQRGPSGCFSLNSYEL